MLYILQRQSQPMTARLQAACRDCPMACADCRKESSALPGECNPTASICLACCLNRSYSSCRALACSLSRCRVRCSVLYWRRPSHSSFNSAEFSMTLSCTACITIHLPSRGPRVCAEGGGYFFRAVGEMDMGWGEGRGGGVKGGTGGVAEEGRWWGGRVFGVERAAQN